MSVKTVPRRIHDPNRRVTSWQWRPIQPSPGFAWPRSDPCDLKPPDVYRQAKLVASEQSRGRDRNWYRNAFELPWQWHIWFDGGREVVSATYSRHDSKWRRGPELSLATLTTGDGVSELLGRLMTSEFFGQKPKAVGVVLHMADEFALAELNHSPEGTEEPETLQMLHCA